MKYQGVEVSNFRSLEHLAVEDLGRINLLVGPNNSGKTSLLEALWLLQAPGNPVLATNISVFRGFSPVIQAREPGWRNLFFALNTSKMVEIVGKLAPQGVESLQLSFSNRWPEDAETEEASFGTAPSGDISASDSTLPQTLEFSFSATGKPTGKASISIGLGKIAVNSDSNTPVRPAVFLTARHRNSPEELASRFTTILDRGEVDELKNALSVLDPQIDGLSIGVRLNGAQSPIQLRVHVKNMPAPIPIQLMGEGVGRLAEILLAFADVRDGLLLVDEIENGLYYRNLEAAWKAIATSVVMNDAQLFATTHSAECVRAAVRALSGPNSSDFRLFRLEHSFDGLRAVRFDHETAESALEYELEFR